LKNAVLAKNDSWLPPPGKGVSCHHGLQANHHQDHQNDEHWPFMRQDPCPGASGEPHSVRQPKKERAVVTQLPESSSSPEL
jgi:hypothetical protein